MPAGRKSAVLFFLLKIWVPDETLVGFKSLVLEQDEPSLNCDESSTMEFGVIWPSSSNPFSPSPLSPSNCAYEKSDSSNRCKIPHKSSPRYTIWSTWNDIHPFITVYHMYHIINREFNDDVGGVILACMSGNRDGLREKPCKRESRNGRVLGEFCRRWSKRWWRRLACMGVTVGGNSGRSLWRRWWCTAAKFHN